MTLNSILKIILITILLSYRLCRYDIVAQFVGLQNNLFLSFAYNMANDNLKEYGKYKVYGPGNGFINFWIRGVKDKSILFRINENEQCFSSEDKITVDDTTQFCIRPTINWKWSSLLTLKSAMRVNINIKTTIDGITEDRLIIYTIHPVNEFILAKRGESFNYLSILPIYVNENFSELDRFTISAQKYDDKLSDFSAINGNPEKTILASLYLASEVAARNVEYSNINTGVADDEFTTQKIRLINESLKMNTGNCLEGTIILASLLLRNGIDASIITEPGHAFVGVNIDARRIKGFETTVLNASKYESPLKSAIDSFKLGSERVEKNLSKYNEIQGYSILNIKQMRSWLNPIPVIPQ